MTKWLQDKHPNPCTLLDPRCQKVWVKQQALHFQMKLEGKVRCVKRITPAVQASGGELQLPSGTPSCA